MHVTVYVNMQTNQKILEQEVDCQTQVMTLNSPINMKHRNCAVKTDPFYLISELIIYCTKLFAL